LAMFIETIEHEGRRQPRFGLIGPVPEQQA
jgi:hypothetical protein